MKRSEEKDNSEGKEAAEPSVSELVSVPFEILDGDGHNMYIAVFNIPIGLEEQIASRYINARGAQFAFELFGEPGKIKSTFYSSDPNTTAEAIGVRLTERIKDPSPPGAEECCIM